MKLSIGAGTFLNNNTVIFSLICFGHVNKYLVSLAPALLLQAFQGDLNGIITISSLLTHAKQCNNTKRARWGSSSGSKCYNRRQK